MNSFPFGGLATELSLCGLGLLMLMVDIVIRDERRKASLGYLAFAGLLLCLLPASGLFGGGAQELFGGVYRIDSFHLFFRLIAIITGVLVVLLSFDYLEHLRIDRGVYFTLIVFGVLATVILAGANDLILVYLGVEFLSITSYILAGFILGRDKRSEGEIKRSAEASLKYLIYGAVASAVMLYGFSLLYGISGSTRLSEIATVYSSAGNETLKLTAVLLALAGLGFKVAAAPFHQWAPDVYEGSPTPVAAFLAVASKAAAFAALARVLLLGLGVAGFEPNSLLDWRALVGIIAVVTMFTGNLLALLQSNIKRMLGYSSVAHAGYLLVGVAANWAELATGRAVPHFDGAQAMLIYLAAYLFMTIGAFAVAVWFERHSGSNQIEDYAGLAMQAPLIAAGMVFFMIGLTGIPPTGGFIGKLFLLKASVATAGQWWLGLMIVINSVISAFYYVNVIRVMYLQPAKRPLIPRPAIFAAAVVGICAVATVLTGIQFGLLVDIAEVPMAVFAGS